MPMKITAIRTHEICAGHRVMGHEGKCQNLHGHGYVFTFYCEAPDLDSVGRVIDFSVIKSTLCEWLEHNWDHKMLMAVADPVRMALQGIPRVNETIGNVLDNIVPVPFNPTAENMGKYLLEHIAPKVLAGLQVKLVKVNVQETIKCGATVEVS